MSRIKTINHYSIRHKDSHEAHFLDQKQYDRFFDNRDPREYDVWMWQSFEVEKDDT